MMMKIALVVLAAVLAVALAGDAGYGYRESHYSPGFHRSHNGISAVYRNDVRQHQVNAIAEHYGAGTGTARWEGVPGTNGYYGYKHHGYGYPRHGGYGGYGYAGAGYGHGYGY